MSQERAPMVSFQDSTGQAVALEALLAAGPLVLVFLRHFG
jgi:hypothetical protein